MLFSNLHDRVTVHLKHGAINAIPAKELAELAGFRSTRALRQYIAIRRSDVVILSNDNGYFLPDLKPEKALKECEHFIARQRSRLVSNVKSTEAAADYVRKLKSECSIFEQNSFLS